MLVSAEQLEIGSVVYDTEYGLIKREGDPHGDRYGFLIIVGPQTGMRVLFVGNRMFMGSLDEDTVRNALLRSLQQAIRIGRI